MNFHVWDCNFFVWKDFYLIFVSVESLGPGDDLRDLTCSKTPPGDKDTTPRSQKLFSEARSVNVRKKIQDPKNP